MASVRGESTVEIAAPAATCWSLLLDVASYPHWYDTLDAVVVESRDDAGRARLVRMRSDVGPPLGSIEFRLSLTYVEPTAMAGRQVGTGSFVKELSSEWRLEEIGRRQTRVTYKVSVSSDGMLAAVAFRAAAALVRRDLIDGFTHALKARAEQCA